MSATDLAENLIDRRIALRLRGLRSDRGWSLDALAARSGVSRASLSRLENAEVSPTAAVLGKLCAVYGLSLSRLMYLVEDDFDPVLRRSDQPLWTDVSIGFERRAISPPAGSLAGEVLSCRLSPNTRIDYETPPRPGQEHHLVLLEGRLTVTLNEQRHELSAGDCLRYRLLGASRFETPESEGAFYHLFLL